MTTISAKAETPPAGGCEIAGLPEAGATSSLSYFTRTILPKDRTAPGLA